jgi:hypothetical protein
VASKLIHEPLLELDGKKINGLKRCKWCGLSETYWERWPSCSEVPRIGKEFPAGPIVEQ